MVFAIHASPRPKPLSHRPPHSIPLGCPRALALSAPLHASNLHWSSILHMVMLGTTDWFQIGKGVHQGCILSPCLFILYREYMMRNAGLEEAQAGIKIAGRNINNLRHADDITLTAESEEELKSLLMRVKKLA